MSSFFWKRVRRFIARFPHPPVYTFFTILLFVILSVVNRSEYMGRLSAVKSTSTQKSPSEIQSTWVSDQISTLTHEQKIGQMMIWGIGEPISSESAVVWENRSPGGFLIRGMHTKDQIASISSSIDSLRLPIKPFIAIDEEGGPVKRMTEDSNPGAWALRQSSDEQICNAWNQTNTLLTQAGISLNFGVIGDIGWKKDVYILPRTFSSSPSGTLKFVSLALQCHHDVIPVVKHFPGHGRTVVNSHFGIPVITVSETEWLISDAVPFKGAIERDVPAIMMGHLIFDKIASEPASLSPVWQKKLREMGFKGLTITDNIGMLLASGYTLNASAEKSYIAGNDMILISSDFMNPDDILSHLYRVASSSSVLTVPIDERIERILHRKYLLQSQLVQ